MASAQKLESGLDLAAQNLAPPVVAVIGGRQ